LRAYSSVLTFDPAKAAKHLLVVREGGALFRVGCHVSESSGAKAKIAHGQHAANHVAYKTGGGNALWIDRCSAFRALSCDPANTRMGRWRGARFMLACMSMAQRGVASAVRKSLPVPQGERTKLEIFKKSRLFPFPSPHKWHRWSLTKGALISTVRRRRARSGNALRLVAHPGKSGTAQVRLACTHTQIISTQRLTRIEFERRNMQTKQAPSQAVVDFRLQTTS
jgi:hypothetical protein